MTVRPFKGGKTSQHYRIITGILIFITHEWHKFSLGSTSKGAGHDHYVQVKGLQNTSVNILTRFDKSLSTILKMAASIERHTQGQFEMN